MTVDLYIAFVGFMLSGALTPGPNNLMVMASSANFGMRRTLPHQFGVAAGFSFMVVLMGLGLSAAFAVLPWLNPMLKAASFAYLLWLAWKIAHAAAPGDRTAGGTPMTFWQAAAFQWVNPKAWAFALSAVSIYMPEFAGTTLALITISYFTVTMACTTIWSRAGRELKRLLTNSKRLAIFNWAMASLLVLSLIPALLT